MAHYLALDSYFGRCFSNWHLALDCKSYELPSFWVLRTWMGICLARPGCGWLGGHEMLRSEVKN